MYYLKIKCTRLYFSPRTGRVFLKTVHTFATVHSKILILLSPTIALLIAIL